MRGPMTSRTGPAANTRARRGAAQTPLPGAAGAAGTPGTAPGAPHTGGMGLVTADVSVVAGSGGGGLESLENFRDLAWALPGMRRGRVLRSAKPVQLSEDDARTLTETMRIRDILDLRNPKELSEDPPGSVLSADLRTVPYLRSWTGQIATAPLVRGSTKKNVVRHNVSFISKLRYYSGMLWHLPLLSTLYAALVVTFNRDAARECMVKEVNAGGLVLMYKTILDISRPEMAAALRIIVACLEAGRPVLINCSIGKDRTGILSALVLSVAGASDEQIIGDYHRSDNMAKVSIAGLEHRRELRGIDLTMFERAPKHAIAGALAYIRRRYGSVSGYLCATGFSHAEQARLRALLIDVRPERI
ncbi:hypothetical protein FOA52_001820 [Chlamydomonas sp. UWO 241]|nr:hypothetical protein FOA52_001820 [Chlamydomonas sp. UWO 241]